LVAVAIIWTCFRGNH